MRFSIKELDLIIYALGNVMSIQTDPEIKKDFHDLIEQFIEERDYKISELQIE
jgi:hypothetical protein